MTFTFAGPDLPTRAGVVWTDGTGTIRFEAFDAANASLGVRTGTHADGSISGTTAEDRFYGIVHDAGISRIVISNGGNGTGSLIEVDHLQFGVAVPEPTTAACAAGPAAGLRRRPPPPVIAPASAGELGRRRGSSPRGGPAAACCYLFGGSQGLLDALTDALTDAPVGDPPRTPGQANRRGAEPTTSVKFAPGDLDPAWPDLADAEIVLLNYWLGR